MKPYSREERDSPVSQPVKPNFNRRAYHHDYMMPAKYMLTFIKSDDVPRFSVVEGNPSVSDRQQPDFPHSQLLAPGLAIKSAIEKWMLKFREIEVAAWVVMPDHVHICVEIRRSLNCTLMAAVASLKGYCSRLYHDSLPECERPEKLKPLFKKGFNDKIAYTDDEFENQKNYIIQNPRRLLIKRKFPDLFRRPVIIKIGNEEYEARGNIFLLKNPHRIRVKFSRKYTKDIWEREKYNYKLVLKNDGVLVSPFIHPEEKKIRYLAESQDGNIIRICDNGFSERFAAQGKEFDLMSAGRLLLVGPAVYQTRKQEMSYSRAQELNELASRIANCPDPGLYRMRVKS